MTTDKDSARPFDYGIDWSGFDKYEESVCDCRCGTSFLSHDKLIKDGDRLKIVTRKPCPSCGRNDDIRAVHGPTEVWSVKG